jgi:hypothetical protein
MRRFSFSAGGVTPRSHGLKRGWVGATPSKGVTVDDVNGNGGGSVSLDTPLGLTGECPKLTDINFSPQWSGAAWTTDASNPIVSISEVWTIPNSGLPIVSDSCTAGPEVLSDATHFSWVGIFDTSEFLTATGIRLGVQGVSAGTPGACRSFIEWTRPTGGSLFQPVGVSAQPGDTVRAQISLTPPSRTVSFSLINLVTGDVGNGVVHAPAGQGVVGLSAAVGIGRFGLATLARYGHVVFVNPSIMLATGDAPRQPDALVLMTNCGAVPGSVGMNKMRIISTTLSVVQLCPDLSQLDAGVEEPTPTVANTVVRCVYVGPSDYVDVPATWQETAG